MITKLSPVTPARIDATGVIAVAGKEIYSLHLVAGSGAAATAVIDASIDGNGTEIYKLAAIAGGNDSIAFPHPIKMVSGAYAVLSGSGAKLSYTSA